MKDLEARIEIFGLAFSHKDLDAIKYDGTLNGCYIYFKDGSHSQLLHPNVNKLMDHPMDAIQISRIIEAQRKAAYTMKWDMEEMIEVAVKELTEQRAVLLAALKAVLDDLKADRDGMMRLRRYPLAAVCILKLRRQ